MAGPWERYQAAPAAPPAGPWTRFQQAAPAAAPAAPEPSPEQQAEATLFENIMGGAQRALQTAGYVGQEFTRGVANVAGLPADAINASPMLLNLLPGEQGMTPFSDRPVGGSDFLYDALTAPRDALGGGEALPQNGGERVLGRVAQEVGGTILPVGGLLAAGRALGVQGARALPPLARFFVEPAAVAPLKTATNELGMAVASGTGAGLARAGVDDGDPNSDSTSELTADLVGSLAGGSLAAFGGAVLPNLRDVVTAGSPKFANRVVNEAVTDALVSESSRLGPRAAQGDAVDTEALVAALRSPSAIETLVPGYRASAADRTGDAGLANLEFGRSGGPNAGVYSERLGQNTQALDAAVDPLRPNATPGQLFDPLRTQRDLVMDRADSSAARAAEAAEAARRAVEPGMTAEARGQTIRPEVEAALAQAREAERAAWSAVQGDVDPAPLAEQFQGLTSALTEAQRMMISDVGELAIPGNLTPDAAPAAPTPTGVLDQYGRPVMRPPAPPVSAMTRLEEVTSLRGALTDAIRAAEAGGQANRSRILNQYVEAVDSFLAQQPDLGPALANARAVSFDLNQRFTRPGTPLAETLATRSGGGPRTPDSRVAPMFTQPDRGQASNIDRLTAEVPAGSPAIGAVRDQVLDDAVRAGAAQNSTAAARFVQERQNVLRHFPGLGDSITGAGAAADAAGTARRDADMTARQLTTARTAVGRVLQYGEERSARAMQSILSSPEPSKAIDEVLNFVGNDPAAVEGARKMFWQVMEQRSRRGGETTMGVDGAQPWMPQKWNAFLDENRGVVERLYRDNPEHLEHLREIAGAMQSTDLRQRARAAGQSGTPQGLGSRFDSTISPATIQSRFTAVQRGQMSPTYFVSSIASTIARRRVEAAQVRAFNRLLDEALVDPEKAAALLTENNPADRAALRRSLNTWYGQRASNLVDLMDGEEEGDPVEREVMR